MHEAINDKWIKHHEAPAIDSFKLKRFTEKIDPKVSTKRGEHPFMSVSKKTV
jgi:hypothetical protein